LFLFLVRFVDLLRQVGRAKIISKLQRKNRKREEERQSEIGGRGKVEEREIME